MTMGYDMWESPLSTATVQQLFPMSVQAGFPGSGMGINTPNEVSMNEFFDFSNCAPR